MTGFDIIIVGIFIISIVVGIMRGLIKEAFSLLSWIAAIWLAVTFNIPAGEWFAQFVNIPNATFRGWLGFALIFIGTLFAFSVISYAVTKLLVRGPIKGADRFLGIFFGAARAGLIVVALLIVLRGLGLEESEWWQESKLLQYFLPAADTIEPMIFDNLPDVASDEESLQRRVLNQTIDDLSKPTPDDSSDGAPE